MKDLYGSFLCSEYYVNMNKQDKRKYTKSFFTDYIEKNIFFRRFYHDRLGNIRACITEWKPKEEDIDETIP